MTNQQLKIIHIAWRAAKLTEEQYRLILKNTAGVTSSKDLDNAAFEDVMAVIEDCGFEGPQGKTYWRDKVAGRGSQPGARMIFKIRQLADASRYDLAAMVRKFSGGRTDDVEQLLPRESWKLIEMLKQSNEREANKLPVASCQLPVQEEELPF